MVTPQGVRANSWQDVADISSAFGIILDPWQELILEASMGERSDRTWAAKRVGISLPRQNGKSQLLVARALAGALLFGEKKIVISAHLQDTAREAFVKLMEIVEADANDALRDRIKPNGIMNAIHREQVKFVNGATIQFKSRSGVAGKGFSSDCLLLDEAQILGSRAWTSINSTMSAMRNPQVWLLGTPPQEEDDCFAFEAVRNAAIDGKSTASAWCEWSADPSASDYDPASEYTRWIANPAWNGRINHEVVQGEYETYSPDRFAQDRLGQWRSASDLITRVISSDEWKATGLAEQLPEGIDGTPSLGIKFSPDGSSVAVVGAMKRADLPIHLELVGAHSGSMAAGTAALAAWVAERASRYAAIVIDGKSQAGAFAEALIAAGVPKRAVIVPTWGDVVTANSMTEQALIAGTATHLATEGQAALDRSIEASEKKTRTDGGWQWHCVAEPNDATPAQAMSLAFWGAKTSKRRPGRKTKGVVLA